MAKLGTTPPANRYDGISAGPRFVYVFETQEGIPVDGTNALLRDLSPFTLRLLPPEALLNSAASQDSTAQDVDLITAAALGSDTGSIATSVANALNKVSVYGTAQPAALENFVAGGVFFQGADTVFQSTLADAFTAADISLQLQRALNSPPLTLLINPSDMSVQHTKIQTYQNRTRYGYVFEAWGEDQPSITFSGSTAGFVAGATDILSPYGAQETGQTSSPSGYQEASRRNSAGWQNFMALYHFYRNNGYIYDTIGGSEAHLFIGAIALDYDQWTYVGHIESFSYSFEEGSPHKVMFDLEFKVSAMYDRALSPAVVTPLRSPTASPTSSVRSNPRQGTALNGRQAAALLTPDAEDIAQIPLDLLGGFSNGR